MISYVVLTGCTLCGMCVVECPVRAISLNAQGAYIDPTRCTGCGICYRNCASEAIQKKETRHNGGNEQ